MKWETVIGLEAHVQLSTETKLFSRASTAFGDEANTNVNLVDCGLPGVLPTVNKNAFYKAIQFGLAIDASINTPWTRSRIEHQKCKNDIEFAQPQDIAEEIFRISQQKRSAWSFDVELRPDIEKW